MSAKLKPHYTDPRGAIIQAPNVGILFAQGTTVPTDTTPGYSPGCIYIDRDAAAGLQVFVNEGTLLSCDFNALVLPGVNLSGLLATAALLNQAANPASQYLTLTGTTGLSAADSNKTFYLNAATEFATTLPSVATGAGCRFTFIVKAAPATASYTVITAASENKILGNILSSQDAGGSGDSEQTGGDTITFVDSKSVVGDRVDLFCDGAFWYATGFCKVFDAITITGS